MKIALNIRATHGEEQHLKECLQSIKDTLPKEYLTEYVVSLPDKDFDVSVLDIIPASKLNVVRFNFRGDFSEMRNHLLQNTSADIDYILWLDPDERLEPKEARYWEELYTIIEQSKVAAYSLDMKMLDASGSTFLTFNKIKIYARKQNLFWFLPVHEDVDLQNGRKVKVLGCNIYHVHDENDSKENLTSLKRNVRLMSRFLRENKKPLSTEIILHKAIVEALLLKDLLALATGENKLVAVAKIIHLMKEYIYQYDSQKNDIRIYGNIANLAFTIGIYLIEEQLKVKSAERSDLQMEIGESYLRTGMTIDPHSNVYYYYLGECALQKKMLDVAKSMFAKALTSNNSSSRGIAIQCTPHNTIIMPALRLCEIALASNDLLEYINISNILLNYCSRADSIIAAILNHRSHCINELQRQQEIYVKKFS
jgi:tetratricopeptide (TPR) repeat protein